MVPDKTVTPEWFHRLATVVLALNALIVLTGAGVRLTGSGLGCDDWPNCEQGQLAPAELDLLGWIEFGNRLFSGVVGLACGAVLVAALRLRPHRRRLTGPAAVLVAGSVAQIILGAIIIVLELDPIAVGGHFLVSTAMLMAAVVLWLNAMPEWALAPTGTTGTPGPWWHPFDLRHLEGAMVGHDGRSRHLKSLGRGLLGWATVVVVAGVVVTGTGPNSGDAEATRLPFEFDTVARIHGVTVWIFLALLVNVALRLRPASPDGDTAAALRRIVGWLLAASLTQGVIGYGQYFSGVPPALVELHILGAVTVWMLTVVVWSGCERLGSPDTADDIDAALRNVPGGVEEGVQPVQ